MKLKPIAIFCLIGAVLCQNKFITLFCMIVAIVSFIIWMLEQIADKGY